MLLTSVQVSVQHTCISPQQAPEEMPYFSPYFGKDIVFSSALLMEASS